MTKTENQSLWFWTKAIGSNQNHSVANFLQWRFQPNPTMGQVGEKELHYLLKQGIGDELAAFFWFDFIVVLFSDSPFLWDWEIIDTFVLGSLSLPANNEVCAFCYWCVQPFLKYTSKRNVLKEALFLKQAVKVEFPWVTLVMDQTRESFVGKTFLGSYA